MIIAGATIAVVRARAAAKLRDLEGMEDWTDAMIASFSENALVLHAKPKSASRPDWGDKGASSDRRST
jgi:hypothetical protein